MIRHAALALTCALALTALVTAASLDKAKALRANGLLSEAKRELVEFLFDSTSPPEGKAEALLLLGDIALDEKNTDLARENWSKLLADYPSAKAAQLARAKLEVLSKTAVSGGTKYPAGTVLVLGAPKYDWAAPQVAGSRGPLAVPTSGSLADAMKLAAADGSVVGILQLELDVESIWETGRLTCYRPNGMKSWDEKVNVNFGGGADSVAHKFVNRLIDKTKSKACPKP